MWSHGDLVSGACAPLVVNMTVLLSGRFWPLAWYGTSCVKVVLAFTSAFYIINILDEANY